MRNYSYRAKTMEEDLVRFWESVEKTDSCWLWLWKPSSKQGYGRYRGLLSDLLKETAVHRISWVLRYGPIPPGVLVLHKCDNPPCLNYNHLFLGDDGVNARDRQAKGRTTGAVLPGELSPNAKLTAQSVYKAKQLRKEGYTYPEIAKGLGVATHTIWDALNGKSWRSLQIE